MKGAVCKKGGKHPVWDEVMAFKTTSEPAITLELMDKDTLTSDNIIGVCEIDLEEVEEEGRMAKWYELHYKRKLAGEILVETIFTKEQFDQDAILDSGTREVRSNIIRGHPGLKMAAKHIIDYREKPQREEKGKEISSYIPFNSVTQNSNVLLQSAKM
jgi:hypothetical protein